MNCSTQEHTRIPGGGTNLGFVAEGHVPQAAGQDAEAGVDEHHRRQDRREFLAVDHGVLDGDHHAHALEAVHADPEHEREG